MDQAERLRMLFQDRTNDMDNNTLSSRVIAVTSGKGGVGKSNFTLNLAIQLSRSNKRVVIFDADFGLANIEILFGATPKYSFADVISGRMSIVEVLTNGPSGVKFISGGSGIMQLVKYDSAKLPGIMKNFSMLDSMFDFILIDTGAGVSSNVLNFIKSSGETIIITTPEPTSLTDAYALIKTLKLESTSALPKLSIVVNKTDNQKESRDIFNKLKSVSSNFLNVDISLLGYVPYDNSLVKSVKKQQPAVLSFPNSGFAKSLDYISKSILDEEISYNEYNQGSISNFFSKLVNIFNK